MEHFGVGVRKSNFSCQRTETSSRDVSTGDGGALRIQETFQRFLNVTLSVPNGPPTQNSLTGKQQGWEGRTNPFGATHTAESSNLTRNENHIESQINTSLINSPSAYPTKFIFKTIFSGVSFIHLSSGVDWETALAPNQPRLQTHQGSEQKKQASIKEQKGGGSTRAEPRPPSSGPRNRREATSGQAHWPSHRDRRGAHRSQQMPKDGGPGESVLRSQLTDPRAGIYTRPAPAPPPCP